MAKNNQAPRRTSKKKQKKDLRRVAKAKDRLAPEKPAVAELLRDANAGRLGHNAREKEFFGASPKVERQLERLMDSFKPKLEEVFDHHNAANYDFEEYTVVENKATELLELMETSRYELFCKLRVIDPSKVSKQEFTEKFVKAISNLDLHLYRLRSFSRMKRKDFEGSVRDATEGLSIASIFAKEDEEKKVGPKPISKEEIVMFVTRGTSLRELGVDLDGAYKDLNAACAAYRSTTEEWMGWPAYEDVVKELLIVMALRKLREGAKRPHYTEAEVEGWQEKLGLRLYSNERHKCLECGTKHADLLKCTGCKNAWFCNKACQKASWKKGHKKECKPMSSVVFHVLMDEEKSAFKKKVAKDGFIFIENQKSVMVQDKETGEYFDSLTDEGMAFFPSEKSEWEKKAGPGMSVEFQLNATGSLESELSGVFASLGMKKGPTLG